MRSKRFMTMRVKYVNRYPYVPHGIRAHIIVNILISYFITL